jgi:hypothetical protein
MMGLVGCPLPSIITGPFVSKIEDVVGYDDFYGAKQGFNRQAKESICVGEDISCDQCFIGRDVCVL